MDLRKRSNLVYLSILSKVGFDRFIFERMVDCLNHGWSRHCYAENRFSFLVRQCLIKSLTSLDTVANSGTILHKLVSYMSYRKLQWPLVCSFPMGLKHRMEVLLLSLCIAWLQLTRCRTSYRTAFQRLQVPYSRVYPLNFRQAFAKHLQKDRNL